MTKPKGLLIVKSKLWHTKEEHDRLTRRLQKGIDSGVLVLDKTIESYQYIEGDAEVKVVSVKPYEGKGIVDTGRDAYGQHYVEYEDGTRTVAFTINELNLGDDL